MNDLYQELETLIKTLEATLRQLSISSREAAQTEMDYKILLRKECLKLRSEGEAIGMIDKICYGIPEVADARFKRDVAKEVLTANKEAINVYKLRLRIIEGQIQREWGNPTN